MPSAHTTDSQKRIEQFYDSDPAREWDRLTRHRIEFAVSLRTILAHLLKPPARILDVGGGPGRYTIALSKLGYEVTLLDLSQENLAFARAQAQSEGVPLAEVVHGNALDLNRFADQSFDGVLLMGPLYHLLDLELRMRCATEAFRIVRPGGIVCASFITRFAAIRDASVHYPEWAWEEHAEIESFISTGMIEIPAGRGFTDHYAAHPTEVTPFMERIGFSTRTLVGVQCLVAGHEQAINELHGAQFERWVELNARLGHDPALHGAADHLLYVGQRQES
jgi:S-adenosylmethionine-dependent methyltransferase